MKSRTTNGFGQAGAVVITVTAALALGACGSLGPAPAQVADTVYTRGKVVTVDQRSTVAEAFAVKDGRFLRVGSNAEVMRHVGAGTRVVALGGRTVIPGLADGHFHSAGGGPGIDLSKTRSLADMYAQIRAAAATARPGDILVSNSDWHEAQLKEQRLPLATELEAAAPGIPLVLVRGGHSYFLNTTALAKWGITPGTPVPAGGAIPRTPEGQLTGELVDTAKPLAKLPPPAPVSLANLVAQQKLINAYGLTSVRVASGSPASYKLFQQLRDTGQASVRYSVLLNASTVDSFKAAVDAAGIRPLEGDEWVRIWGVKLMVDGGFEGGHMSHAYAEPYGQDGKFFGLVTKTPADYNALTVGLNRLGWRIATHAVGDAAVDQVLAGYEKANADKSIVNGGWAIEHAFISRPDQFPRMKALQLRLSVQDHLYLAAPVLKKYWGADRASQVTPVKTYLDQGFVLAAGTDSPVIPFNPFWVMYHFLTRDTISDGVYGANQAVLSREQVLRMLTINNAKLTDEEAIKGSIEAGKLADFLVLPADYLTVPVKEVETMRPLATYVGGKLVYRDAGFQP